MGKRFFSRIWCELFHDSDYWPIHGRVTCKVCLKQRQVNFR